MKLSTFQIECIEFIINSSEGFEQLLAQVPALELKSIEHTGVGCIYSYELESTFDSSSTFPDTSDFIIEGGFLVTAAGLPSGASLMLWIEKGRINALEVLALGADFPKQDPTVYAFDMSPVNIIIDKKDN